MNIIYTAEIDTPLGTMVSGATAAGICFLEFNNRIYLQKEMFELQRLLNAEMVPGSNIHLAQLKTEILEYFEGSRKHFNVALDMPGNEFSKQVWQSLMNIPYGTTITYKEQAIRMAKLKAIRAVATTNGKNRLAIIVPCHRVIGSNGTLTGYAAGIEKKKWLLNFEREHSLPAAGCLF